MKLWAGHKFGTYRQKGRTTQRLYAPLDLFGEHKNNFKQLFSFS